MCPPPDVSCFTNLDFHGGRSRFLDRSLTLLGAVARFECGYAQSWRVGLLLIVAGVALYFATAFWGFAIRGKGTPAPLDPPKKLVVEGPYSVVRNPMYWSVFFVMLGEAAVFRSLVLAEWAVGFFVAVNLFVPLYEEPTLKRKFGEEYEKYCHRVPRWIPGMKGP